MSTPEVQENLANYIAERKAWVGDAVELVTGSRDENPLQVFPQSTEVRRDAPGMDLTADQETQLREIAGRFGIGGEQDVVSTAEHHVLEGGLVWKIEAEAANVGDAKTVIFAGWSGRQVNQNEIEYVRNKYGTDITGISEYDVARFVATQQPGFTAHDQDIPLPFGYDVNDAYALMHTETGQLVKIGDLGEVPVLLLRVDENPRALDDRGRPQKPDGADLMVFISDVLSACGDETSGVALSTSNTYSSRAIDAVKAGLKAGRFFDVSMYGRETLANVKGTPVAEPTEIFQIPSELHTIYTKLVSLEQALPQN
ncbi:MAG TPA: hypothetical protein VFN56_01680 [Candidatus Saccharimonadales bacterium]|nr:hypothetical protein [Candidatus Saccharimonadales bacterium]